MQAEYTHNFINCYEYLNVAIQAPLEEIQAAFDQLVARTQLQLNNPLTANTALYTHNVIEPVIEQYLLTSPETRADYNQLLVAHQEYQKHRDELASTEGLDDLLDSPFFFDPFNFDTETPAHTLREIALKIDEEWAQASTWLTDTTDETHIFLSFLIYRAGRPHLATQIEPLLKAINERTEKRISSNEALERCIMLLNPQTERPGVTIFNPGFDGKVWQVGEFITDAPARSELQLSHEGVRGCVLGSIESQTDWVQLPEQQHRLKFALMPSGTSPELGPSEIKIPLTFQLHAQMFAPNTTHRAFLLVRLENYQPVRELQLPLDLFILPIPPRVTFAPPFDKQHPLQAGSTRQGELVNLQVTAFNSTGHQNLAPLAGRITTNDPAASALPMMFQHNSQITLSIDTHRRPRGQRYEVVFDLDYTATPGAQGPKTLHVQGEILPTTWQSMQRIATLRQRIGIGLIGLVVGGCIIAILGNILAASGSSAWLTFLLIPVIFGYPTFLAWKTLLTHRRLTGEQPASPKGFPLWLIWTIPCAVGLLLFLLCATFGGWFIFISALLYALAGGVFGFIMDDVHQTIKKQAGAS